MGKLGNWHDKIGTTYENSPNREAPNKHTRGSKKYKEMIDRDSKNADRFKNLPFTFSKPPKRTNYRKDIYHICDLCAYVSLVSKYRVSHTCGGCRQHTGVHEDNKFSNEEEMLEALERWEPATDDR